MRYLRLLCALSLLSHHYCSANIVTTYFNTLKENKLVFVSGCIAGCITGALATGCLWYYKSNSNNSVANKSKPYLNPAPQKPTQNNNNHEEKINTLIRKKTVNWFFYPSGCVDENVKHLFIDYLQKDACFVRDYNFEHTAEDIYIGDNKNKTPPLVFIRGEERFGETIIALNKKIAGVTPIYIIIYSAMGENRFQEITSHQPAKGHFYIACMSILNQTTRNWDYTIPDVAYNQTSREWLFQKIHQIIK